MTPKDQRQRILTIPKVLSTAECVQFIVQTEQFGFQEQQFGYGDRLEIRHRLAYDDSERAGFIWSIMKNGISELSEVYKDGLSPQPEPPGLLTDYRPIGLNDRLRFYKYKPGQRFSPHVDLAHEVSKSIRTFLTVIIYLNEDFSGGQTSFEGITVEPQTGMALIFPHELRHEGRPVTKGVKYVLRTDVLYQI